MTGQLVLVSTPIGNLGDLSPRAVAALQGCALICCEDTRHSGKLLSHAGISGVRLAIANEHTEAARAQEVIDLLGQGRDVAVITDAGTPGISDPGSRLVRAVLDAGYAVSAVPGPAALVMALVISGFDTSRFVFEGFLPRSGRERTTRLAEVAHERRTIVLYEAPHRVQRTIADLAAASAAQVWPSPAADEVRGGGAAPCRAITHLTEREPRGEYVVVVEGAPVVAPADLDDDAILTALRAALAADGDRKAAVATVMAQTGAPKRRVYDLALTIPRATT
jgi:16S rRNA (cytidine1402-2'-O)-methyltransferase